MKNKPDKVVFNRQNGTVRILWLGEANSCGESEIFYSLKIDIEDFSFAEFKDHKAGKTEEIDTEYKL